MTTEYRYRPRALRGDYIRGGAGLVLAVGPLAMVDAGVAGAVILALLAALFLVFTLRTVVRHLTRVRVDGDGIAVGGPISRGIKWRGLASVVLSYYTTKRDSGAGWMQLKLTGTGVTLRIESTLDGFAEVVKYAASEAEKAGVDLAPTTVNNMRAMGVVINGASRPVEPNGRSVIRPGP